MWQCQKVANFLSLKSSICIWISRSASIASDHRFSQVNENRKYLVQLEYSSSGCQIDNQRRFSKAMTHRQVVHLSIGEVSHRVKKYVFIIQFLLWNARHIRFTKRWGTEAANHCLFVFRCLQFLIKKRLRERKT